MRSSLGFHLCPSDHMPDKTLAPHRLGSLLDAEAPEVAHLHYHAFPRVDGVESFERFMQRQNFSGLRRNLRRDFEGDCVDTVAVSVNQISGANLQASDFDGFAEFDDVGIGMGYGEAACEEMEAQRLQRG